MKVLRLEYELPKKLQEFDASDFIKKAKKFAKENIGREEKVFISVSGGTDSTTVLELLSRVLSEDQLYPVSFDDGFRRIIKGREESKVIRKYLGKYPNFRVINVRERFFKRLKGLTNGEAKRKIFQQDYAEISNEEIEKIGASWVADGTTKADRIETERKLKTQHNVNLPYKVKKIELLASLYKPHVRKVAKALGLPDEVVYRQPFPGPGLILRMVGEINEEKLKIVRNANDIVEQEFENYYRELYRQPFLYDEETGEREPFQVFAAVLDNKKQFLDGISKVFTAQLKVNTFVWKLLNRSTYKEVEEVKEVLTMPILWAESRKIDLYIKAGVRGFFIPSWFVWEHLGYPRVLYRVSGRIEEKKPYLVAIRAVKSKDAMTAEPIEIEFDYLQEIGEKILKEVPKVAAVAYDVSHKPPATIEFE